MDELISEITADVVPELMVYTNSTMTCPYCIRAKDALTGAGYPFVERDIADPEIKAELLAKRPSARTVPQIFLMNDYYIGGCDDLMQLLGNLNTLIELNS